MKRSDGKRGMTIGHKKDLINMMGGARFEITPPKGTGGTKVTKVTKVTKDISKKSGR